MDVAPLPRRLGPGAARQSRSHAGRVAVLRTRQRAVGHGAGAALRLLPELAVGDLGQSYLSALPDGLEQVVERPLGLSHLGWFARQVDLVTPCDHLGVEPGAQQFEVLVVLAEEG